MVSSISSIRFAFELAVSVCAACCDHWGPGAVLVQRYTLSVHALFYHVPVWCSLFYSVALFFLRVAVLGISFSPTLTARFISIYLFYSFIHLFIYVSSTEPSVFRVMGAQRGLGNLILSYLFIYVFIWNHYTGWLSSALK